MSRYKAQTFINHRYFSHSKRMGAKIDDNVIIKNISVLFILIPISPLRFSIFTQSLRFTLILRRSNPSIVPARRPPFSFENFVFLRIKHLVFFSVYRHCHIWETQSHNQNYGDKHQDVKNHGIAVRRHRNPDGNNVCRSEAYVKHRHGNQVSHVEIA